MDNNCQYSRTTVFTLINNSLTEFILKGYVYPEEKFDSIPYQHTSYGNPDFGYNTAVPFRVNKLNFFRDTLLASGNSYFDFCLAGGGGAQKKSSSVKTFSRPNTPRRVAVISSYSSCVIWDSFSGLAEFGCCGEGDDCADHPYCD